MKIRKVIVVGSIFAAGCGGGGSYGSGGGNSGSNVPAGTTAFTVTAPNAPESYNISGTENPSLTLQRGQTYTFTINETGHPFYIMSVQGTNTSNAFTEGVTGNGSNPGTLTFVVPQDAPNTLFYDCSLHPGMSGTITITN
jgi:plastocyanin